MSAADCERLQSLKNQAVGALENERVPDAVTALQQLQALLPNEPLVSRNLAVARLLGMRAGGAGLTDAEAAVRLLLAQDQSPEAHWLAGRMKVAVSEQLSDSSQRETALQEGVDELQKALAGMKSQQAAVAFERYEATRYAAVPRLKEQAAPALAEAVAQAPGNLFLLTEILLQQVESRSPEAIATLGRLTKGAGPLREGVLRRTRVKLDDLISAAEQALQQNDSRVALAKCRQISAVLRPEERVQSDRRQLSPHPLEFLLHDFVSTSCVLPAMAATAPLELGESLWTLAASEGEKWSDVRCVDFDLNGRPDVLLLSEKSVRWLEWDKDSKTGLPRGEFPVERPYSGMIAVDMDRDAVESGTPAAAEICQDADPDLILYGSGGVAVYRNDKAADGSRTLAAVAQTGGLDELREVTQVIPGDFDHDGDLDLACLCAGQLQMWIQAGPLTFVNQSDRLIPPNEEGTVIQSLAAVDWDRDVDLDLLTLSPAGLGYFENLRHGEFRWRPLEAEFAVSGATAFCVLEADGRPSWDLAVAKEASLDVLLTTTLPRESIRLLQKTTLPSGTLEQLRTADWNNDGAMDLLGWSDSGVEWFAGRGDGTFAARSLLPAIASSLTQIVSADLDGDGDLDLLFLSEGELQVRPNLIPASNGWTSIRVRGAEDPQSGRVNQYGIGGLVEVRAGGRYQAQTISAQSTHFGLGTATKADSVRVLWTNGVPQVILQPERNQALCERLTLKGSCPYVYTWTGERFEFFTDLLWGAPIGLQFAEGVLAPSRAWEYLLIPAESLKEHNQHYELRVTEELWEAAYFDQIELLAIDHPADVAVYSNEKVGPPDLAEFKVHTVAQPRPLKSAHDLKGRDVLSLLSRTDGQFVKAFDQELRQGLTEPHGIELDLGPREDAQRITLFLTGWIYPTDTALNVALSQDPTLEGPFPPRLSVLDANGDWQVVRPFMGFPGGKTKTIAIDLSDAFLTSDFRVRIETSHEIYWDSAFWTADEEPVETVVQSLPLVTADLHFRGFSVANLPQQNTPETYDYSQLSTIPRWPPMDGFYTRYGDVAELLKATDDRLVVMASGEEISLKFALPQAPLRPGWKRDFFLHNVGWDKDADLHTVYGQSVEPLPFVAMPGYPYGAETEGPSSAEYQDYLRVWQTRRVAPGTFWNWKNTAK